MAPLRAVGTTFVPPILGSVICCSDGVDEHGWPLVDEVTLDQLASFGANWTHIRLGPYIAPEGAQAYKKRGGRYNLAEWDEEYWARVAAIVEYARSKSIYVEIDIVDAWSLKPEYQEQFSTWAGENNPNGVDLGCAMLFGRPPEVVGQWVYKVVQTLGKFPNVVWQISNESGVCGSSRAWEEGVVQLVRDAGSTALIGTNSDDPSLCPSCDFDSYHQQANCTPKGRPCQVNEFSDISVEDWIAIAGVGHAKGTPFHMWRSGNWHEADNLAALEALKNITKGSH